MLHSDWEDEPYSLTNEEARALLDFEELRIYEGEAKIRRIREKAAAWEKGERARYTYELVANALSDIELAFAAKEYGFLVPEEYLRGLSELAEEEMLAEEARSTGCSLEEFTDLWHAFGERRDFTAEERERLLTAQKNFRKKNWKRLWKKCKAGQVFPEEKAQIQGRLKELQTEMKREQKEIDRSTAGSRGKGKSLVIAAK